MAFFFNRTDAPHLTDLLQRVEGYTRPLLNTNMVNPIMEVGDMVIVHLHPDYADMLAVYEKYGFSCGINYRFKVTRLLPWNHPSDADARAAWVTYTRNNEQAFANKYFDVSSNRHWSSTKYYDSMGREIPPPPKLARSTNSPRMDEMYSIESSVSPSYLPEPLLF